MEKTEMNEQCPECAIKVTPRSPELIKSINNRISRIVGQLGGIKKMIDEGRYCGDVLLQISAVESALQNLGYLILQEHMHTCVVERVKEGDMEVLDEALTLIKKLRI